MLRTAQGCSGWEQGRLYVARVAVMCTQVSKWEWSLERLRFGYEYHVNLYSKLTGDTDEFELNL